MNIRRVIFLDIDGTLNDNSWKEDPDAPWILPSCAKVLDHIISETGAQLILTSQRRQAVHTGRISMSGFQVLLKSHGIRGNLAGHLPYTDDWEDKRFLIKDWLRINNWNRFCVLDDVDMHSGNQVFPNSETGLIMDDAEEAIGILNGEIDKLPKNIKQELDDTDCVDLSEE